MEKVIINSYEDFEKLVGQQIGVSEYVELSQERINLFADSTLDHQWIQFVGAAVWVRTSGKRDSIPTETSFFRSIRSAMALSAAR